jgi:hypothetical protein
MTTSNTSVHGGARSAFRYPGRLLTTGEVIPEKVIKFIAAQLGMQAADLEGYAVRKEKATWRCQRAWRPSPYHHNHSKRSF